MEKITVYADFSFRVKKTDSDKITLAFTLFRGCEDNEHPIYRKVVVADRKFCTQFTNGIQAYEFALSEISALQGRLIKMGVDKVVLVTDNSILAKWIAEPWKSPHSSEMSKANRPYLFGGEKELWLTVEVMLRKNERAYKYCNSRYIKETEGKMSSSLKLTTVEQVMRYINSNKSQNQS